MPSLTGHADHLIGLLQRAVAITDVHGKLHAPKGLGKLSGRFVPKPDVRTALANATTTPAINQAIAAETRRITGRTTHVDLKGADPQVAREIGEGILRGLEHTPTTKLTSVRTYGPAGARPTRHHEGQGEYANARPTRHHEGQGEYANARTDDDTDGVTTEIGFNNTWMSNPDKLRASLAEDGETTDGIRGSTANGAGPMGLAIHEFGHVAASQVPATHEWVIIGAQGGIVDRYMVGVEWEALAHVGDLVKKLTGSEFGNRTITRRDYIAQKISSYASWERGELVADAFADVVLHGHKAPELSRAIYKMVTRGAA